MATIGRTNPHGKRLRREATDAERQLWHHLPNRQLAGFKFRRQVTIGPFIADFACVDCKVIVEADGGQHGSARDAWRTSHLETLGWRVLRFWNNEVLANTFGVLEVILAACEERQKKEPSPRPLPQAGEG
ncbi:MAG: endonuclease domain-containing protein [Pseudomonadota bacterium]